MPDDVPPGDGFLGGRLRLLQPPRGAHRAGTDAVLLARLLLFETGQRVCDVGAGTGAVGLVCALLAPGCRVELVERDPETAAMARANVEVNGLSDRVGVIEADVLAPAPERRAAGLTPERADCVLTNPPFFAAGSGRPSPNPSRAMAHRLPEGGLGGWLRTCTDLLRPGGRLGLIHRAEALPLCLDGLRNRFGAVAVRPVHPRADAPAIRILLSAVKGSRAPLRLLPPLVLHDAAGRFTEEAARLHSGKAPAGP